MRTGCSVSGEEEGGKGKGKVKGKGKEIRKGRVWNKLFEDFLISYVFGFILDAVLFSTSSLAYLTFELEKCTQNP